VFSARQWLDVKFRQQWLHIAYGIYLKRTLTKCVCDTWHYNSLHLMDRMSLKWFSYRIMRYKTPLVYRARQITHILQGSPIDFDSRPYNRSALPCCLWCTHRCNVIFSKPFISLIAASTAALIIFDCDSVKSWLIFLAIFSLP